MVNSNAGANAGATVSAHHLLPRSIAMTPHTTADSRTTTQIWLATANEIHGLPVVVHIEIVFPEPTSAEQEDEARHAPAEDSLSTRH